MSKLTIELYDMKLKINFPESLSSLHQQIKEQFCFSDSEMKGISIIYEHNLEEKSIQKEEDFTEFAKLNLYLIQLKINQKSELFKQSELDLKKENEKNKLEIEKILGLIKDIINQKNIKKEETKKIIAEYEQKINELEKNKREYIQKIDNNIKMHLEQIKKMQDKLKKENNDLDKTKKKLIKNVEALKLKLGIQAKEKNEKKPVVNSKPLPKEQKKSEQKKIHINFQCDGCAKNPIEGIRYHCQSCRDYDLCEKCFYSQIKIKHGHSFSAIKDPIKVIPTKENTEIKKITINTIHTSAKCDICKKMPIVGIRYKCGICDNFDFCEICEKKHGIIHGHPMFRLSFIKKIKIAKCFMKNNLSVININPNEKIIFKGISCNKCRKTIEGFRYKCAVCKDFDFCGGCVELYIKEHEANHPFVKLYHPNMKLDSAKFEI